MLPRWIAFDVETLPGEHIEHSWLPEVKADGRLKDAAKIEADLAEKEREQWAKLSLDWYGARIASIAWQTESDARPLVQTLADHLGESQALEMFWQVCGLAGADTRVLLGYCCRTFDLPLLVTRSRLLGVSVPRWLLPIRRYGNQWLLDLYDELGFDGTPSTAVLSRGLRQMCRNFCIDVPEDDETGADIQALAAAGDWDLIAAHNRRDVERVVALAKRLQIIRTAPVERGLFA